MSRSNPERDKKIASMYRQGLTMVVIGGQFDLTRERVRQILKRQGIGAADGGASKCSEAKREARVNRLDSVALKRWGITHAEAKAARSSGLLRAFIAQRQNAANRGIAWLLNFCQWRDIWNASGKLDQRGRGKGRYVMSRINDEGGYQLGNVHIQLAEENGQEAAKKWRGKQKTNPGVFLLYPGLKRPWLAAYGGGKNRRRIGYFATEEEAVAARDAYMEANGLRPYGVGRWRIQAYERELSVAFADRRKEERAS